MSSTINNLLFNVQNMSPALLSIGVGKAQNYNNLSELSSLWNNSTDSSSSSLSDLSGNSTTDKVSLTYKNIGNKVVTDMATVTANTIKEYPSLDKDYVIAIIDDGTSREARVYSRKTILENYAGTDAEKAALEKQLDQNPLMVFSSGNGLPVTATDAGSKQLAENLNAFLKTNNKTLNTLDKAGYDPLADMLGNTTLKKILANCANPIAAKETLDDTILAGLNDLIGKRLKENPDLDKDYVVAIIDDGTTREARVYSRADILANYEGTDEAKEALKKQLDENPVMVFSNSNGLPPTASKVSSVKLAEELNAYLKLNKTSLDSLSKSGKYPLADLLGSSSLKDALAKYAA